MKIQLVILIFIFCLIIFFVTKIILKIGSSKRAKQIKITELSDRLIDLRAGITKYDVLGICANNCNCIYFVCKGENFNIEFEAITAEQASYIEPLEAFADSLNIKYSTTTYNNKSEYDSQPAPVLRLETNTGLYNTVDLAIKIQENIFHENNQTIYDVVP